MTTPRDAIGLSDRLAACPDDAPHFMRELMDEAATALDALQARVKELEAADRYANLISIIADIREKSGLGGYPMLSELADAIGSKLADAESRATSAEQERDEALERLSIAANYFNRYCHDEAAEPELCVSEQHHEDAKAFEEAIRRLDRD